MYESYYKFISWPTFGAYVSPQCLECYNAHKLTPVKRDVNTVVSDQRSRFTALSIGDYSTPDTVAKHRRRK